MSYYNIQWDLVAVAPVLIGLWLSADLIDQRAQRKKNPPRIEVKEKKSVRRVARKRKSGFRSMKSHGQRMRERMRRQEAEGAPPPPDGIGQPQN